MSYDYDIKLLVTSKYLYNIISQKLFEIEEHRIRNISFRSIHSGSHIGCMLMNKNTYTLGTEGAVKCFKYDINRPNFKIKTPTLRCPESLTYISYNKSNQNEIVLDKEYISYNKQNQNEIVLDKDYNPNIYIYLPKTDF